MDCLAWNILVVDWVQAASGPMTDVRELAEARLEADAEVRAEPAAGVLRERVFRAGLTERVPGAADVDQLLHRARSAVGGLDPLPVKAGFRGDEQRGRLDPLQQVERGIGT